ncbi:glycerate kinase [Synechococcales cyanobacterium C]|uniref:Glycerate kinase n=1 Tax=Petrachloros mirabilis ULC683 TaxID=2781853 RepID=A0A8K1ZWT2_9CYAN|nr:glycerate kinase [Petrachloros mirabilis]NCJ06333.1 glycerate kinase [Petrachloros mirabilis ULC683]
MSAEEVLAEILQQGETEIPLSANQEAILSQDLLADAERAAAFGITPQTVLSIVRVRSQHLPQTYALVAPLLPQQPPEPILTLLWHLWLPLTEQLIAAHQALGRPLIQGILGMQGCGKTTLTTVLCQLLNYLGYSSLSLSIDDLYKTYAERQTLLRSDPRLIWRGPPGTHDIELGIEILQSLRQGQPPPRGVPRFDKTLYQGQGDRTHFEPITPVDIVLFEGWFVGLTPLPLQVFEHAPAPITTADDRQFALDMNHQLQHYQPLWNCLDRLMILNLADYRLSKIWRTQAEQAAIAAGKSGMSDTEVSNFVDYFWRALHPALFMPALCQDAQRVSLVIEIKADHNPGRIYRSKGVDAD